MLFFFPNRGSVLHLKFFLWIMIKKSLPHESPASSSAFSGFVNSPPVVLGLVFLSASLSVGDVLSGPVCHSSVSLWRQRPQTSFVWTVTPPLLPWLEENVSASHLPHTSTAQAGFPQDYGAQLFSFFFFFLFFFFKPKWVLTFCGKIERFSDFTVITTSTDFLWDEGLETG